MNMCVIAHHAFEFTTDTVCVGKSDSSRNFKNVFILIIFIIIFLVLGGSTTALVAYILVRRRQTRREIAVSVNPVYAESHSINTSSQDQTGKKVRLYIVKIVSWNTLYIFRR